MTGLAIGLIKARDEISEVVVVIAFRTRLLDTFVLVTSACPDNMTVDKAR